MDRMDGERTQFHIVIHNHIYAAALGSAVISVFANMEAIADELKPLTVSQMPSENSQSAIGRTPIPVSR
jgi:hypothetical protein